MKKHAIQQPLTLAKKTIHNFHPLHFTRQLNGGAAPSGDHSMKCPQEEPTKETVPYETQVHIDSGCCCSLENSGCMTRIMYGQNY